MCFKTTIHKDNMNKLNVDKFGANMANVSFGGSNSTRITGNNDIFESISLLISIRQLLKQ